MDDYHAVCEAVGEFKNLDKFMRKKQGTKRRFLFWTWTVLKKYKLNECKLIEKDTKECRRRFKNLNVNIYGVPIKAKDCFTFPGFFGEVEKFGASAPIKFKELPDNYVQLAKINLEKVKVKGGIVIFPPNTLKTISIFMSYGALTSFTMEERLAVYLHEIGHWNYLSKKIPRQILFNKEEMSQDARLEDGTTSSLHNISLLLHSFKMLGRFNEYESDLFAVRCGYGKHLKSALQGLSKVRSRLLVDALTILDDKKVEKYTEARNQSKDRIGKYPSIKQRGDQIDYAQKNKSYMD
jgi:hypothetical protein